MFCPIPPTQQLNGNGYIGGAYLKTSLEIADQVKVSKNSLSSELFEYINDYASSILPAFM